MNRREFVSSVMAGAATPLLGGVPDSSVRRVLVVFKCHLDVGFVDTQAAVIRKYYDVYFPQAMAIAKTMRKSGDERYVWTTGSWLLYTYLEQANNEQRRTVQRAIEQGDLAWHALPFSWQTELIDQSMMAGCIGFSKTLDARFGRTTTGAKMTDVPGHTRGLIAPLNKAGVTLLDIGVNAASTPPDVPDIFVWKNRAGQRLTIVYHRKDYGGVVTVPGSDLALAVEVRNDNSGPHTAEEIHAIYAKLRARFPGAAIHPASMTDVATAVQPYEKNLPLVTAEIGDTWIYGVASDPAKVAHYRELLRLRAEWVNAGKLQPGDKQDLAFLERFSLAAEHTWGTDTKTWLDFDHYTPQALASMLNQPNYQTVTHSWAEKRQDIVEGVSRLPGPLRAEADKRLAALQPARPDLTGMTLVSPGTLIDLGQYRVGFDSRSGAMTYCKNKQAADSIASQDHPLALLTYQTLSQADYDRFLAAYITVKTDWAPKDFGKPGINAFGVRSGLWHPTAARVWQDGQRAVVEMEFGGQAVTADTAWPEKAYLVVTEEEGLHLDLSWFGKRANRLPEALWLTFRPRLDPPGEWSLSKSDERISPFDVVAGGNRHMHALTGPLQYGDRWRLDSLDGAVVSLGVMSPIWFSNDQPDISQGFHYSLFNNGWGTNYIQWFGEDAQFRFRIQG